MKISGEAPARSGRWGPLLPSLGLLGLLAAFLALITFGSLGELGTVRVSDTLSIVFSVIATGAAFRAALATSGQTRRGWFYVGLGIGAWAIGEILWGFYEVVLNVEAPFPSMADVAYVAGYPYLLAGILNLAIPKRSTAMLRTIFDATVVCLLAGAALWHYVLQPITTADSSWLEVGLAAAYPVGDLVLIFGLAVATLRSWRDQSGIVLGALGAGLAFSLAADLGFAVATQEDTYFAGSLLDVGWLGGYALIALAAGLQSRWLVEHEAEDLARTAAAWRQAAPLLLLIPTFAWAFYLADAGRLDTLSIGILAAALALVVARSVLNVRDLISLNVDLGTARLDLEVSNALLTDKTRRLNDLLVEAIDLARHDSLTGLLNHGAILDELSAAIRDSHGGIVVAMIDVDDMKRLNDDGGHETGDNALREIASRLRLFEGLVPGRYGGDEFLAFLKTDDAEAAKEHVEKRFASLFKGRPSVSWGVASYPEDGSDTRTLVNSADRELYEVKRARGASRGVIDAA